MRPQASGAVSGGRSPTCQSLIYFWGAYLPCIWLCASKMLVNLFEAERLVVFAVPSLFSLCSPKLGLLISQPLRGWKVSGICCPQSVIAVLAQTGVMDKSTPSGLRD